MTLSGITAVEGRSTEPMAARCGILAMRDLTQDIGVQLSKDRIMQAVSAFHGDDSLCALDTCLSDISGRLRGYLADVYTHLNIISLRKAELREDFSAVNQLMSDIDAVQQHIVSIPFDIIEFHAKHGDYLKKVADYKEPLTTMRKLALSGHREWLQYQSSYITEAIRSVSTLYNQIGRAHV